MSGMIAGAAGMMMRNTGVWTPAALSPPCWYNPGLGHSAADGGNVSPWSNQGTNALFDAAQATGSAQFVYDEVDVNMNNQPSMYVDGGDRLISAAGSHWEPGDGGDAVAVVFLRQTISGAKTYFSGGENTTGFKFRCRDTGSSTAEWEDTASATIVAIAGSYALNTVRVFATVLKGAATPGNDVLEYWIDGVLAATVSADRAAFAGTPVGGKGVILGSFRTSSGSFGGNLGHMFFFNRQLTAGEDASFAAWGNGLYAKSWAGLTQ